MSFTADADLIRHQTELLVAETEGADLRTPVPSCPGWTLGMLLRHLGGAQHWAEEQVRTRAAAPLPDDYFRQVEGDDTGPVPARWLLDGAVALTATLHAAGPELVDLWTPVPLGGTRFWARRFAYETVVHRADAVLALGREFTVDTPVALGAVEEWLDLDVLPMHFEYRPAKRELLGPGRVLSFVAPEASWTVDLTGEVIRWRWGAEADAAVTVRGGLVPLLLGLYQRLDLRGPGFEVSGDRALLDRWVAQVAFA